MKCNVDAKIYIILKLYRKMENIKRIRIDNTDVFLEDLGQNKGKITISDTYNHNYSYFWGSMGGTLEEFLLSIDAGYFANKLIGYKNENVMDVKKTFASVRKFISNEISLPWYQHMYFQKDMRERLSKFQSECEEYPINNHFVSQFFCSFVDRLDFDLIDDKYARKQIEKDFNDISEHWYFIETKPSNEFLWLQRFHGKLKTQLKNISKRRSTVSVA